MVADRGLRSCLFICWRSPAFTTIGRQPGLGGPRTTVHLSPLCVDQAWRIILLLV